MIKQVIFLVIVVITLTVIDGAQIKTSDEKMPVSATTKVNVDDEEMAFDLAAIMKKCNETYKIDMAYLESLNESGSFPDETDKSAKCYIKCMLEETGIVNADDDFNTTRTAMVFAGKRDGRQFMELQKMASSCSKRSESCKCEKSYQYIKCFMEKEIENYEEDPMDS